MDTELIKTQIDELDLAVRAFERVIMELEPDAFLEKLGGWTPRDIVAHLVGWNAYVVEGSRQLQRGELPFYDRDPGDNYEKVNAELIRKHGSTERDTLVLALESSAKALAAFLRELDDGAWEHDFGVQHGDETLTVRSTVNDLIQDYDHHRHQIETWSETT
jgi:hypothetical protein